MDVGAETVNEAVLVTKFPGWTKTERAAYGGVPVRFMQATDWRGNQLVLLLGGPLVGSLIWVSAAEIVRQEAAE